MTYDLITVGRANMDLFAQQIGADFENVSSFDAMVGGSPTNIAIGTARLGLQVIAFTAVGGDRVGDFILRYLSDAGVVTNFIPRVEGKLTSLALIGIKPPAEFPLSFYREDPADIYLTIDHARDLPLASTRAVLLSGNVYSRGRVVATADWMADEAVRLDLLRFVDLDLRPLEWADHRDYGRAMRRLFARVDVAIGTEEEFHEALSAEPQRIMARGMELDNEQHDEVVGAVGELVAADEGVAAVVLKHGPGGASVLTADETVDVPGFPVTVVNTVGAGDAFASGLITKRLAGWNWFEALRFANACGALVVTRHGCSSALPTEPEVMAFIDEHGGL